MKKHFREELIFAIKLTKKAGSILLSNAHSGISVKNKIKADIVTTADIMTENFITKNIKDKFPNDGILCEEKKDNKFRLKKERVWIVDPLDGTHNFLEYAKSNWQNKEYQYFGIHVGFCINKKVVLGVVYCPTTKEIFYAELGKGAYKQVAQNKPKLLKISKYLSGNIKLSKSVLENPRLRDWVKKVKHNDKYHRVLGYYIVKIAENEIDAFVQHPMSSKRMGEWDACAPSIILEEAGGLMTDFNGKYFSYNNKNPYLIHGLLAQKKKNIIPIVPK